MHHPPMKEDGPIAERPLHEVIAAIGSDHVSPGAGAAGAVALGLAAACAHKAAAVSLKHHPDDAALLDAAERLAVIARRALLGADRDSDAFRGFIQSPSPQSTARLIAAGATLAHLIDALHAVIDDIEPRVIPTLVGDVLAARALAGAARTIQEKNSADT